MTYLLIFIGVAILLYFLMRSGNLDFWKVANQNANQAYDLFINDDCWVVIHPNETKPDLKGYTGPFKFVVPKLGNTTITVYGKSDCFEESQKAFLNKYKH